MTPPAEWFELVRAVFDRGGRILRVGGRLVVNGASEEERRRLVADAGWVGEAPGALLVPSWSAGEALAARLLALGAEPAVEGGELVLKKHRVLLPSEMDAVRRDPRLVANLLSNLWTGFVEVRPRQTDAPPAELGEAVRCILARPGGAVILLPGRSSVWVAQATEAERRTVERCSGWIGVAPRDLGDDQAEGLLELVLAVGAGPNMRFGHLRFEHPDALTVGEHRLIHRVLPRMEEILRAADAGVDPAVRLPGEGYLS